MITNPTVIRTLDTRSLIAVTVSGSNGDNVGGTVTVSKDGTSYTATTDSNGQANVFVDSPGSWTVGYDKSGIMASGSVNVAYSGYTYSVSLSLSKSFTLAIYNVGLTSGTATFNDTTINLGSLETYADAHSLGTVIFSTFAELTSSVDASVWGRNRTFSFTIDGSTETLTAGHSGLALSVGYATYINGVGKGTTLPQTINDGDYVVIEVDIED